MNKVTIEVTMGDDFAINQGVSILNSMLRPTTGAATGGTTTPEVDVAPIVQSEVDVAPVVQSEVAVAPKVDDVTTLDKDGVPWDERIHGKTGGTDTGKFTAKGIWQKKKGVDSTLYASVTKELQMLHGADNTTTEAVIPPPPAATTEAVIPPPPVAGTNAVIPPPPPVATTHQATSPGIYDFTVGDLLEELTAWIQTGEITIEEVTNALITHAGVTNMGMLDKSTTQPVIDKLLEVLEPKSDE